MTVNPKTVPRVETQHQRLRRLTSAKIASELLGIPLTSLYDLTREGRIPGAIRIGRRIHYDLDKLLAWIDAGAEYCRVEQ